MHSKHIKKFWISAGVVFSITLILDFVFKLGGPSIAVAFLFLFYWANEFYKDSEALEHAEREIKRLKETHYDKQL